MRKRIVRTIMVVFLVSIMVVTPVFASSLEDMQADKAQAESEAGSLQEQIKQTLEKIQTLEKDLETKQGEIDQAGEDLEKAASVQTDQYNAMKLRIKYMYEEGNSTAIETLVSAENFTDLMNKAEYVQNVHKYDREQLEEYVETKNEISDLKTTLEEDQKAMESLQAEYESKETELNTTIETKKAEVADLDVQIQAAAEAAAREAEERRRREEEARRAQEEAANNQANNGNTNSGTANNNSNNTNNNTNNNSSNNTNNGTADNEAAPPSSNSTPPANNAGAGNTSAAQTIVSAAYGQLGVPYVWGGTSPGKGLDCSGLVQYCHSVAGISIGRTSQVQGGGGKAVSSPQPGDVVCYGSHIGIYIGNGQMIHAPHTGDVVRVASVYGSPWYRRYW